MVQYLNNSKKSPKEFLTQNDRANLIFSIYKGPL